MGKLRMLWSRVKGQAVQVREDEAFEEEMHEHIALLEKRHQAQGTSARESAQAARRQFGNVAALVNGNSAWSEFHWDFHATLSKDGSVVTTHGVETQVYRKEKGEWRLVHVHYSERRQSTP